MAIVVKWLTHLAVNQTFVGSIPIVRPILKKLDPMGLFFMGQTMETFGNYAQVFSEPARDFFIIFVIDKIELVIKYLAPLIL